MNCKQLKKQDKTTNVKLEKQELQKNPLEEKVVTWKKKTKRKGSKECEHTFNRLEHIE